MRKAFWIVFAVIALAVFAYADIYRAANYEPRVRDDLQLRIEKNGSEYIIAEDAELFRAKFATVHYPEYDLTYAQHKELTRQIARTIAKFHSATNGQIRFGHYEYPETKGTNIIDKLIQGLGGKFVTDETIKIKEN